MVTRSKIWGQKKRIWLTGTRPADRSGNGPPRGPHPGRCAHTHSISVLRSWSGTVAKLIWRHHEIRSTLSGTIASESSRYALAGCSNFGRGLILNELHPVDIEVCCRWRESYADPFLLRPSLRLWAWPERSLAGCASWTPRSPGDGSSVRMRTRPAPSLG